MLECGPQVQLGSVLTTLLSVEVCVFGVVQWKCLRLDLCKVDVSAFRGSAWVATYWNVDPVAT